MILRRLSVVIALLTMSLAAVVLPGRAQNTPAAPPPGAGENIAFPIRTADTLRVVVAGAETMGGDVRVESDGTIALPRLGPIKVDGLQQAEAARVISQRIVDRKLLKRADVGVYIISRKARSVVVNGSVTNQGPQPIKDMTVLSEVLEAALPTATADLTRVVITRDGRDMTVNYKRYRSGESNGAEFNPLLQDQDRIYVYSSAPTLSGTVRVSGEVKDPTKLTIPITEGMTVAQALQTVGGVTDYADRSNIFITRGDQRIPVPYDEILRNTPGKDIPLQNNDVINIPRLDRPKEITVAGAVRNAKTLPLLTRVTLLEAVGQSGGPIDGAQQDKVELRRRDSRGNVTTHTYNLLSDADAATELIDGDYVFVPYPKQRPRTDAGTVLGILSGIAVIFGAFRR